MAYLSVVTAAPKQAEASPVKTARKLTSPSNGTTAEILQTPEVNREAEVCDRVDDCQRVIRQRVDSFFTECLVRVAPWVDNLLDGKKSISQTPFYDSILPQQALDALVEELRLTVQSSASGYFGVTSLAGIKKIDLAPRMDAKLLQSLFKEYRRTLLTMQLAAEISNRACRQSINGLKAPFLLDKVLEKLEIGANILQVADCCPRQNRANYRQTMITQVNGMIQTIRNELATEACHQAAISFYELYDLVGGQCEKNTAKPRPTKRTVRQEKDPQSAARALA